MNHDLKIEPKYLEAKLADDKLFEIRLNDRGFQKGDTVTYTDHKISTMIVKHAFKITYVTNYAQKPNLVVFGERRIPLF